MDVAIVTIATNIIACRHGRGGRTQQSDSKGCYKNTTAKRLHHNYKQTKPNQQKVFL